MTALLGTRWSLGTRRGPGGLGGLSVYFEVGLHPRQGDYSSREVGGEGEAQGSRERDVSSRRLRLNRRESLDPAWIITS